jgi:hypothetical protein
LQRTEPARENLEHCELGEVAAERVHQRRSLTDQEVAAPVQHQYGLLVDALDRHEAHRWPAHSFADRFRVGSVVLVPLHIGPHVLRWHEPNRVPELLDLVGPMMRTRRQRHQGRHGSAFALVRHRSNAA